MEYKFSVKELPVEERPRERLLMKGSSALSLAELLAIILGKGIKGQPAVVLSQRILARFGYDISKLNVDDLLALNGIGVAKACQIVACFELGRRAAGMPILRSQEYNDANQIYKLVKPYLIGKEKEHFLVVSLDARRRLIAVDNISIGSISQTIAEPREVFKSAINRRASFVVLAHNHPSGDPEPTADDLAITERLVNVSYTIGIPVLDHIIVSENLYVSLYKEEYIPDYI